MGLWTHLLRIIYRDSTEQLKDLEKVRDIVAYADDIMNIVEGNPRVDIEEKLRAFLLYVQNWCETN